MHCSFGLALHTGHRTDSILFNVSCPVFISTVLNVAALRDMVNPLSRSIRMTHLLVAKLHSSTLCLRVHGIAERYGRNASCSVLASREQSLRRTSGFLCIVQLSAYKTIVRFLELPYDYGGNIALPLNGLFYSPQRSGITVVPRACYFFWYTEFTYELRFARDAVVTSSD